MRSHFKEEHSGVLTRTHLSSLRFDSLQDDLARARGILLMTIEAAEENQAPPLLTGICDWEFQRAVDEGWRLRRCSTFYDQPS